MSHNILKWLSGSLILLSVLSCKKQKGVLDDFPPGRFDFVYVLNTSSNQDTVSGELSGPYVKSSYYTFEVRQELSMDKSLKAFSVGTYKKIIDNTFKAQVNTGSTITYENHDADHLFVQFAAGDTLSGSLTLTRKE
ncbi:hypothetical protein [Fluviicola chungangensis]|uniref:Uncharacterized protein n=1 Tax=Fluviicola chungangensis TaxID=2597671 RepID=A0A556MY36_9FLAO|nr:hypothetical protein [Fluviicola chungangensis]TSJ44822.1 hypothetical protein FO442_09485 [Fluviicola chungangensis]